MKALCFLITALLATTTLVPAQVPTNGLVAYYPFNGNANDESGNGIDGVNYGATLTSDRFNVPGKAYSFNGSSYIGMVSNSQLPQGNEARSASVWVYNSISANQVIIEWGEVDQFKRSNIGIRDVDGIVGYSIYGDDLATVSTIRDGKWHNIVLTYDGITTRLYVDGTFESSKNMIPSNTQGNTLFVGKNHRGSIEEYNVGKIDDIRIYNRALSDCEIQYLYHENGWGFVSNGLVAYYPFNGNANDESGNGWNGTVNGAALTTDRFGSPNKAFSFNGNISNTISTTFPGILGDGPRTISFWQTSNNTTTSISMSYGAGLYYPNTPGSTFLVFSQRINSNQVIVGVDLRFGGIAYIFDDNGSAWHNFTFIVPAINEPKTGDIKVYRDGILLTSVYSMWGDVSINTLPGADFLIGQFVNSAHFSGNLDDIRIYNRALTVSEILSLFQEGECPCPGTISGTVSVGSTPLAGVIVKLLDEQMQPVGGNQITNTSGAYSFTQVLPGNYNVMVVEPLGYVASVGTQPTNLGQCGANTVNFTLTNTAASNNGRSKGYWKHQFDVYVSNTGNAQETQSNLNTYISLVHQYYTPHFSFFSGMTAFSQWQSVLSVANNSNMLNKAKAQLAALVMNLMSYKIGQSVVVSADGRTAGDVLTYVSEIIAGSNASLYELAKNLAEAVNTQQMIGAGIVPSGTILYKDATVSIYEPPADFSLSQNHPNPFSKLTSIRYSLPTEGTVTLSVTDVFGKEVVRLLDGVVQNPGTHSVIFESNNLPSGMYYYRLETGQRTKTKIMVVFR